MLELGAKDVAVLDSTPNTAGAASSQIPAATLVAGEVGILEVIAKVLPADMASAPAPAHHEVMA